MKKKKSKLKNFLIKNRLSVTFKGFIVLLVILLIIYIFLQEYYKYILLIIPFYIFILSIFWIIPNQIK